MLFFVLLPKIKDTFREKNGKHTIIHRNDFVQLITIKSESLSKFKL